MMNVILAVQSVSTTKKVETLVKKMAQSLLYSLEQYNKAKIQLNKELNLPLHAFLEDNTICITANKTNDASYLKVTKSDWAIRGNNSTYSLRVTLIFKVVDMSKPTVILQPTVQVQQLILYDNGVKRAKNVDQIYSLVE